MKPFKQLVYINESDDTNNFISKLSDYKKERYGDYFIAKAWCVLGKYQHFDKWFVDQSFELFGDKLRYIHFNNTNYVKVAEILFKEGIYQEDPIIKVDKGEFIKTEITFNTIAFNSYEAREANMKIFKKLESMVMQDRAKRGIIENYIESLKQQGILRDNKGNIVK